jgi:hypothetical protein
MGDTLNGELAHVLIVSILDAAILSWIALWWYRRSVVRFMTAPATAAAPDHAAEVPADAAEAPARGLVDWNVPPAGATLPALPPAWRNVAAAYVVGALAYSTVMTIATTVEAWPVVPAAMASVFWVNLWPLVPVLALLLALRWNQTLWLAGLFVVSGSFLVVVVTLAGQIVRGVFNTAPLTNIYWSVAQLVVTAYAPAFVLLLISRRRIRAVFAMTLAATILFGAGLMAFRRVALEMFGVAALKTLILELAVKTTSDVAYYAIYMLVALPVGWIVWQVLRRLAVAFERKAFSDIQLVVDCWFAIVTMELIVTQLTAPYGLAGIAIGAGAFVAYRGGVEIVLRIWPPAVRATAASAPARLLLLRVFGHQSRTERLFDYIARHWRFRGPVQLIAGADLAMRTVDPGDVLAFVSGRLRNQYVASPDEIPGRIARLDMRPDPDGRFRVNELYCLHDTWKTTLQTLLSVTDMVVMDLRGFTRQSKGCLYELQQIVASIATDRIVLIADRGTDQALVEETLGRALAQALRASSMVVTAPIAVVEVNRNSRAELGAVLQHLLRIQ